MADPLVVLVFLMSAGQPEPLGQAMTSAARQALGRDAVVLVEDRSALPTSEEAESLGQRERAVAVVEVEWRDPGHATVRVHREHDKSWRQRDIVFLAGDPPDERGRTIGFALASLIETENEALGPAAPSSSIPPDDRQRRESSPAPRRILVEAAGVGTAGGGAGTLSAGGEVSGMVLLVPRLAAVVTGDVRFGEIAGTDSRLSCIQVGGGLAWRALVLPSRRPFEVDARADVLATFIAAAHSAETQSAWLPGARVGLEAVWFPAVDTDAASNSPRFGILAMAGGEAAFGSAFLIVANHTVATVPPFRAVAELGVRAQF